MLRSGPGVLIVAIVVAIANLAGCARGDGTALEGEVADFAALQERGEQAMGVDQYTSTHVFDALPDGGRIELQRDMDDAAGVAQIRQHLQEIARAFQDGDFSTPAFVHMKDVPGASVMAERGEAIAYSYGELPRGAEVRIVTSDPEALEAIHAFLAFQREEHHAGGHEHPYHARRMKDGVPHHHNAHEMADRASHPHHSGGTSERPPHD